jgi:membrane protein involved in colicin uptake
MTTKLIINCATGETSEVELTAEEIAQREADAEAFAEAEVLRLAEVEAKAEAKASAQAKLKALGLSDAEVEALVG